MPLPPDEVVAEREATGVVAPFIPVTPNLALVVDAPPIRRSTVELFGVRNPAPSVQLDEPPHEPQAAVAPPLRQSEDVPSVPPRFIAPDARESPVAPLIAPPVETSRALEAMEKLSPPSPRVTIPLAVRVCPFTTVRPPEAEIRDETARVPVIEVLSERAIEEDPESITMFPVVAPPNVRVLFLRD